MIKVITFLKRIINSHYFIAFAIITAVLLYFYPDLILEPNDHLITWMNDGKKNYYTYLYHVKHDNSFFDFNGMNYPFGEYTVFTDNQPFYAGIAQLFGIEGVWFHNLLLFFNIITCGLISVKLLIKLKFDSFLVISGAVGFALMSPQIFRLVGHYSLSYSFYFPLLFLLLFYFKENWKIKFALLLLLVNLIMYFTHPYLGAMGSLVIGTFAGFYVIRSFIKKEHIGKILLLSAIGASAIVLFYSINGIYDTHVNRTSAPLGFFNFSANFYSIFLPSYGVISDFQSTIFGDYSKWLDFDNYGYVGLFSIISFLIGIIGLIVLKISPKKLNINSYIYYLLTLSVASYMLATCFPFKLNQEFWKDHLGPLEQLRAIGRFGWIFFFSYGLLALYLLQSVLNNVKDKKKFTFIIAFPLVMFLALEIQQFHKDVRLRIDTHLYENIFKENNNDQFLKLVDDRIKPEEYSSMIAIPFYHYASEIIDQYFNEHIMGYSLAVSYHTGIPMMNLNGSRASFDETRMAINIVTPTCYPKQIESYCTDKRKILVISDKNYKSPFDNNFLDRTNLLGEVNSLELREMNYEDLFAHTELPDTSSNPLYFEGFDEEEEGHLLVKTGQPQTLFETDTLKKNHLYELSYWVNYSKLKYGDILTRLYRFEGEKQTMILEGLLKFNCTHIIKDWARVNIYFSVNEDNIHLKAETVSQTLCGDEYLIDNVLLIEENQKVVHEDFLNKEHKMLNNFFARPMVEY